MVCIYGFSVDGCLEMLVMNGWFNKIRKSRKHNDYHQPPLPYLAKQQSPKVSTHKWNPNQKVTPLCMHIRFTEQNTRNPTKQTDVIKLSTSINYERMSPQLPKAMKRIRFWSQFYCFRLLLNHEEIYFKLSTFNRICSISGVSAATDTMSSPICLMLSKFLFSGLFKC